MTGAARGAGTTRAVPNGDLDCYGFVAMRGALGATVIVFTALGVVACTLSVNLDNLTGGVDAALDATAAADASARTPSDDATANVDAAPTTSRDSGRNDAADAAADADADETDADVGPSPSADLVANGGFETETGINCGPNWSGYYSTINGIKRPRTGAYSCLVCNNFDVVMTSPTPIDGGPQFVVGAYARVVAADGSDAGFLPTAANCNSLADGGSPLCAHLSIYTALVDGGALPRVDGVASIGSEWSPFGAQESSGAVSSMSVEIGFKNVPAGDCVLLDDVSLTYQQ